MKSFDQILKESYSALDSESILIPRRSPEERKRNFLIATNKKIREYIRNGSIWDLDLQGTPITSLPEGLTVGGNLYLAGTPITSLPEGLIVGGGLYLGGTPITSLPEGLTVNGSLSLYGTSITSLPKGLTVGGDLYLYGTSITSLPEGLTVGGSLWLEGTPLSKKYSEEELKRMLPGVKGDIYI